MRQTLKIGICLLVFVCGGGAFLAHLLEKANADKTVSLANGVQVMPVEVQTNDTASAVAAMQSVKIWKLNLVFPPTGRYDYYFVLCKKGKPPVIIEGATSELPEQGRERRRTITVALAPVASAPSVTEFTTAQNMKIYFTNGSFVLTNSLPNPLKGTRGGTETAQPSSSDNLIYLLSRSNNNNVRGDASLNDIAVALSIQRQ